MNNIRHENISLIEEFFYGDGSVTWKNLKSIFLDFFPSTSENTFLDPQEDPRSSILRYLSSYRLLAKKNEKDFLLDEHQNIVAMGALVVGGLDMFWRNKFSKWQENSSSVETMHFIQALDMPTLYFSRIAKSDSDFFLKSLKSKKIEPDHLTRFLCHFIFFQLQEQFGLNIVHRLAKGFLWSEFAIQIKEDVTNSLVNIVELFNWEHLMMFLKIYSEVLPDTLSRIDVFNDRAKSVASSEILAFIYNYFSNDEVRMFGIFSNKTIRDIRTGKTAQVPPIAYETLRKLSRGHLPYSDFGYDSTTQESDRNKIEVGLSRIRILLKDVFDLPSESITAQDQIVQLAPKVHFYDIHLPPIKMNEPTNKANRHNIGKKK